MVLDNYYGRVPADFDPETGLSKTHEQILNGHRWEWVKREIRVTDPETGGEKGSKPERFDLIPVGPLTELARLYGRGANKYAPNNWRQGYKWSLSFAAMQRHAWQFWNGQSDDPEMGTHHLASVAFHAFALLEFDRAGLGTDDRWTDEVAS
jgi:hypothetical protein